MAKAVTEKNTKAQILEAYEEVLKELKAQKAGKTTTADVVKAKEIKETKEAAKEIVDLGILNDDMTGKYKSLIATIEMLEKDVEELYGIKKEADTLEALMNTYKDKDAELAKRHEDKVCELNKDFANKVKDSQEALKELKKKTDKDIAALNDSYKEKKDELEKERKREEEEYAYDLERKRAKENDEWADTKAKREKELAEKELAVVEREKVANEAIAEKVDLLAKIELLSNRIEEVKVTAFEEGKTKAKKEAETSKVFSDRAHKSELERKDDRIATLEAALEESKKAHEADKAKLDAAYTRIQEMAIEAAKNSGVRMVESTNK